MKTTFRLLSLEQKIAVGASVLLAIAFIAAIFFFRQLSNSDLFSFTPVLILLAVSVPAGIIGIVLVQVRQAQAGAGKGHIGAASLISGGRRTANVSLDSASPAKDPFEAI